MATHWGYEGQVKIGANAVAELEEWSFDQSVSPVVDTAMGDTAETHIAGSGISRTEGSLTCHWDETDTTGQGAMTVGASVTLNLYPEGASSGDVYWTCTASIIAAGLTVKKDGETIKRSFRWLANGAVTRATL